MIGQHATSPLLVGGKFDYCKSPTKVGGKFCQEQICKLVATKS